MPAPRFLLLATSLTALFAGCATALESGSADEYQPPTAGRAVATLKGSRISEGGLFGEEHTGFVYMIDLLSVRDARSRWDESIALAPGRHTIMAEYHFSNFKARSSLILTASAGSSYQVMIKNGHESGPEGKQFCDFWIVDVATGKTVTPILRAQTTGGKKGTIFNIPS